MKCLPVLPRTSLMEQGFSLYSSITWIAGREMMKSELILVVIFTSLVLSAQNGLVRVAATTPRETNIEDARVSILVDGGTAETPCAWRPNRSGSFVCQVKVGKHSAMFWFKVPGYKPYSVNVASVNIDKPGDVLDIKLGVLQLTESEEPRIENIVVAHAEDGFARYQITIHNVSKKQILITGISMQGSQYTSCAVDLYPPGYFKMSDNLVLTVEKSGKRKIVGTVAD